MNMPTPTPGLAVARAPRHASLEHVSSIGDLAMMDPPQFSDWIDSQPVGRLPSLLSEIQDVQAELSTRREEAISLEQRIRQHTRENASAHENTSPGRAAPPVTASA